ncbi:UNKNOWN [Stylonychia lemnae]|uniref:FAR1 domain-containing protein n=1 Tax=Stylonychia lemnae TaxID=5949 RepID=A0A078AHB5_STYLE|nr:UNKNOWN [Stylonychia lemnae]|eukprot:CDW80882.1 UNKNOWN [Stylonychia lemnae]
MDIDDLFHKYNDYAKDHGFKMRKNTRKAEKNQLVEYSYFQCSFGHTKVFEKHGGYRKTQWKNDLYKKGTAKSIPCKAKVIFEKNYTDEWCLKEIVSGHNHEPDHTLLSNEIVYYIDEFVTKQGCKISAMEIVNHLRARFNRDFDLCTLLHHISQRFDIVHKAENVEFGKDMVKEYPSEVREGVFDDYELRRLVFITNDMINRYEYYGEYLMFIDGIFSPKFIENYILVLNGVSQDGDIQVFGVIICKKEVESLKICFEKFLKFHKPIQPKSIVIDSDPFILEAAQKNLLSVMDLIIVIDTLKMSFSREYLDLLTYKDSHQSLSNLLLIISKEYYEQHRWKVLNKEQTQVQQDQTKLVYILHQTKQMVVTQQKNLKQYSEEMAIDQVKQREFQTIKHKLLMCDEEDVEQVTVDHINKDISCTCEYANEYGGLPYGFANQKLRQVLALKLNQAKYQCFWIAKCAIEKSVKP